MKISSSLNQVLYKVLTAETMIALFAIILVNAIVYNQFFVPAIYFDDWTQVVGQIVTNSSKWLDLLNRRPLVGMPQKIESLLFGMYLYAFYFILWSLHFVIAALWFKILGQFSKLRNYSYPLIAALLFLTYPTNYAQMWLTMAPIYLAFLLTLIYALLFIQFSSRKSFLHLGLALTCLLVSYGFYESQLGIACALPVILFFANPKLPWLHRFSLISPIILSGAFMLWRTLGYQSVGIQDFYLTQLITDPRILISNMALGFKVSLLWGWTTTLNVLLPWLNSNFISLLLLAAAVLGLMLIARSLPSRKPVENLAENIAQKFSLRPLLRSYFLVGLAGLFLVGCGYVPILTVYQPNLSGVGSRVNYFSSLGSVIFLISVLMIGAILLAKSERQIRSVFIAAVIPFLLLGAATQISVQKESQAAWREQQAIWKELFAAAPDFKDGTAVLFVLHGYQDRVGYQNWKRTPLTAPWEISSALQILYNNPTLTGNVIFPDVDADNEPRLTLKGIADRASGEITPYHQTVGFEYDPKTGILSQIDALPQEYISGATGPVDLGKDKVQPLKPGDAKMRWLVGE